MRLKYQTVVAASPEEVFHYVTGYPVDRPVKGEELQEKYGVFLPGEGPALTFREDIGGDVTWDCLFEPPGRRIMRTVDSSWSDRIDSFVATPQGTLWQITWEVKARGIKALIKWLAFQFSGKGSVERRLVIPVLSRLYDSTHSTDVP